MKFILVMLFTLNPLLTSAQEIARTYAQVEITEPTLLVTHASKMFIEDDMVKEGIDQRVKEFKSQGLAVIYLMNKDDSTDSSWFTEDRKPTIAIESSNGDHHISLKSGQVTVIGGFFTLCFDRTVEALIHSASKNRIKDLTINMPLSGIYEDKSLFMSAMNLKFEEIDFFFSIEGHRTLKFFKDNMSKQRFIQGLKVFFEYKKDISYEVYLDGKRIFRNHVSKKRSIKIIFT